MHPSGQRLLVNWGFPDFSAVPATQQLSEDIKVIRKDLDLVKTDLMEVRSNVAATELTVSGFQVDFNRWKTNNNK